MLPQFSFFFNLQAASIGRPYLSTDVIPKYPCFAACYNRFKKSCIVVDPILSCRNSSFFRTNFATARFMATTPRRIALCKPNNRPISSATSSILSLDVVTAIFQTYVPLVNSSCLARSRFAKRGTVKMFDAIWHFITFFKWIFSTNSLIRLFRK